MIHILDFGVGNVRSIVNMIERVGGVAKLISNPRELSASTKLILPGVGAFDHGIACLREGGWIDALNEAVLERKVPVLGICLGMQLMCKSSDEGSASGLGWVNAHVRLIQSSMASNLKVPHMGWNAVTVVQQNPLIPMDGDQRRFYFVHSYHVVPNDEADILARTHYGFDFVAAFRRGNVYGVQFHPEKSHRFGKELLGNFVRLDGDHRVDPLWTLSVTADSTEGLLVVPRPLG
jgi:imidazole glycerol-phosphate synthase subunit HisH